MIWGLVLLLLVHFNYVYLLYAISLFFIVCIMILNWMMIAQLYFDWMNPTMYQTYYMQILSYCLRNIGIHLLNQSKNHIYLLKCIILSKWQNNFTVIFHSIEWKYIDWLECWKIFHIFKFNDIQIEIDLIGSMHFMVHVLYAAYQMFVGKFSILNPTMFVDHISNHTHPINVHKISAVFRNINAH